MYETVVKRGALRMQDDGCTPLHKACTEGHDAVVTTLLRYGASPTTPLVRVCLPCMCAKAVLHSARCSVGIVQAIADLLRTGFWQKGASKFMPGVRSFGAGLWRECVQFVCLGATVPRTTAALPTAVSENVDVCQCFTMRSEVCVYVTDAQEYGRRSSWRYASGILIDCASL